MSIVSSLAPQRAPLAHAAMSAVDLSRSYGATVALEAANIVLKAGEVHALLGENGAGKSTLVKILTGAVRPDRGRMQLHDSLYSPKSINQARAEGVATAFQELSLIPNLTVAQNLLLPRLPKHVSYIVSAQQTVNRAEKILQAHGLGRIDPVAEIGSLPMADRQRLEIVRALENATRLLILDEPTAALAETDWLFDEIGKVTAKGVAVLYISHRLAKCAPYAAARLSFATGGRFQPCRSQMLATTISSR